MKTTTKMKTTTIVGLVGLLAAAVDVCAQDQSELIEQMQDELKALRAEVQTLKNGGSETDPVAEDLMGKDMFRAKGLSIGFYGEAKYRWNTSGANTLDPHRFVLTPSYQLNDWLIFNSEVEFEHGGVDESAGRGSRFDGEIELEQMYVDILINDYVNIRSPGITLIPMGRVNLYHEPTTFYSTERPELYREIIPSTWMEPTLIGAFGNITDDLDYYVAVTTGLQDGGEAGTGLGAGPGITAANGIRNGRPRIRRATGNALAYSGRLHYSGIKGLDTSASFYLTTVRGGLNDSSAIFGWDIEALYRLPDTGLELRGDFAMWHVEKPHLLLENNDATATDDIGKRMFGYYFEAAYHLWPKAWREGRGGEMDLVPFMRYTHIRTQDGLSPGTPQGAFDRKYLTTGLSWFLSPNFVVKGDYRRNVAIGNNDYYQVGVGMFF